MSRRPDCRVFVVAGDAGGANALAPVLERLEAVNSGSLRVLAYREARAVWGRRGLRFEELPEETSTSKAAAVLQSSGAAVLVSGTSVNTVDLEKRFVVAARNLGIPSLALLDYWSNYRQRFDDAHGALTAAPDVIAVMDANAKAEMVTLGFDPGRLVVTGQPAFDALPSRRARFSPAVRRRVRRDLGAEPGELVVAFASQPLAEIYGSTAASPGFLGFTEADVLNAVIGVLRKLSQGGTPVRLVVLPHPRQSRFEGADLGPSGIPAVVSRQQHPLDVAMASDLVIGMSSVLLVEACYLGCPTVSLQPGLLGPDTLPTNRIGVSEAVHDERQIERVLTELLGDAESRRRLAARAVAFQVEGGATDRVVELIEAVRGDRMPTQPVPSLATRMTAGGGGAD